MKNKKIVIFSSILMLLSFSGFYVNGTLSERSIAIKLVHRDLLNSPKNQIKNGDLIFQTSVSKQSKAIQLATKS